MDLPPEVIAAATAEEMYRKALALFAEMGLGHMVERVSSWIEELYSGDQGTGVAAQEAE